MAFRKIDDQFIYLHLDSAIVAGSSLLEPFIGLHWNFKILDNAAFRKGGNVIAAALWFHRQLSAG